MALENNQINNLSFDNDEISLKELVLKIKEGLHFLKSKWKVIFLFGFIGSLIGLTIALFEKPTYKAVLTFAMEEDKGGAIGGAAGIASTLGFDISGATGGGGAFAASNLGELMKSRLIIEKVLLTPILVDNNVTSLAEFYIKINKLRGAWKGNSELKSINFLPGSERSKFSFLQDSILKTIHKNLIGTDNLTIMQKDKKTSILSIEVKSENEMFAKIFCENLAKETSDFYIQTKSKKSKMNVEILQKQVDSIKNTLNSNITGIASAVDNVFNLNPALNIKGAIGKKIQLDIQANTSILTNLVVQLELAKIALRKETPLIQLIDKPILPLEKNKFGKLNSIILGGLLSTVSTILYLIFIQLFKKIAVFNK